MTFLSMLRDFHYVAREAVDALRLFGRDDDNPDAYRRHLADLLAEKEAGEEVAEPQGDCGLGGPYSLDSVSAMLHQIWEDREPVAAEPPLTADELVAVRQLIEERFPSSAAPGFTVPDDAAEHGPALMTPDPSAGPLSSTGQCPCGGCPCGWRSRKGTIGCETLREHQEFCRVAATLGLDPASVHARTMRQRREEDREQ